MTTAAESSAPVRDHHAHGRQLEHIDVLKSVQAGRAAAILWCSHG
ncbi:MAG TPA: hypothetical protein VHN80_25040 [Kineosporiaceae bacterium]|nr:hypothetical protein [Kineosporiaceae bacterium]